MMISSASAALISSVGSANSDSTSRSSSMASNGTGSSSVFGNSPSSNRGEAVQDADGLRVLRLLLLFQNGDHIIEAWRPDGVGVHPFLRIDAAPLERLLHGVAQSRGLAVAEIEHALQYARDGENVLDGLRLPVPAGAGHQRVERNAVPAHIVDT